MHKRVLYTIIGGFVAGVLWRSLFDFGTIVSILLLAIGFVLCGLFFISRTRVALWCALLVFAAVLGVVRFDFLPDVQNSFLEERVGENIEAVGIIVEEPDVRDTSARSSVRLESVEGKPVHARVLVITDPFADLSYGDRIVLSGVIEKPESFETDTGRLFDYGAYLAKDAIGYLISFASTTVVESGQGNPVLHALFSLKRSFIGNLKQMIPEPHVSLLSGLLVGEKHSLGEELEEKLRIAGVIHIVVLSGYNITIVADALMRVVSLLPFFTRLSVGSIAIVLFVMMAGASATAVRAGIMALLVILAKATGRTYDILHALFIAGFFMVLHNPRILLHDPSFQLSFLATLGLIVLSPRIEVWLKLFPTRFQIREFATATIATQILVTPLLLYLSGAFSLVSLPANLLILAFIPLTMLFGFLAGTIGFVSTVLALPFAFIVYALLWYEITVVDVLSSVPFASVSVPSIPVSVVVGVYILFAVGIWHRQRKRALQKVESAPKSSN